MHEYVIKGTDRTVYSLGVSGGGSRHELVVEPYSERRPVADRSGKRGRLMCVRKDRLVRVKDRRLGSDG